MHFEDDWKDGGLAVGDYKLIDSLLKVMARLRDPDVGCPWDKQQTFSSISSYTLEETYEVLDAIDRNDMIDLCEELGDLLLQVVFHAQIAEEAGQFSFSDVVAGITGKMVRRHPYVFGSKEDRKLGLKTGQWEEIKAHEREEKNRKKEALHSSPQHMSESGSASELDSISNAQPSFIIAQKLQKKAAQFGFDWPNANGVLDKLNEEVKEFSQESDEAGRADHLEEEIGDILFTAVNLARHHKINADIALRRANLKFRQRFSILEQAVATDGKQLEECDINTLENYWQLAKVKLSQQ